MQLLKETVSHIEIVVLLGFFYSDSDFRVIRVKQCSAEKDLVQGRQGKALNLFTLHDRHFQVASASVTLFLVYASMSASDNSCACVPRRLR